MLPMVALVHYHKATEKGCIIQKKIKQHRKSAVFRAPYGRLVQFSDCQTG